MDEEDFINITKFYLDVKENEMYKHLELAKLCKKMGEKINKRQRPDDLAATLGKKLFEKSWVIVREYPVLPQNLVKYK